MLDEIQICNRGAQSASSRKNIGITIVRYVDGLNRLLRWLVGSMLFVMVLIVFLQILSRFALPKLGIMISVPWTEELARYLMIWCIFLGAAAAARSGDMISMDTLTTVLSSRNGWKVKLFAYVVTIAFFVFLVGIGVHWMGFGFMEFSTVMNIPMYLVYMAMPVGAVLAIINITVRSFEGHHRMKQLARHESDATRH